MATWKSENSMLTQVGVDILNKVKAGIGSITISRVVAGSGRVDPSTLYTQTDVSGEQKPMSVFQTQSYKSGSEISISISNTGFTEKFDLQMIGIFVTHPDYEGERLYHISQCDEDGYDSIPVSTNGAASFAYTLYLEHGNADNFTVTIDPEGMLPALTFHNFKKSAVAGNLVTLDENGNLIDTGESIESIKKLIETRVPEGGGDGTVSVDFTVSAETLEAGSEATVREVENDDGSTTIVFGIPKGDTPVKGQDYFTENDKGEMVNDVLNRLPISVDENGYTDFTGIRKTTAISMTKVGSTITIESTLEGDVVTVSTITLDSNGHPTKIVTDGAECIISQEGFE